MLSGGLIRSQVIEGLVLDKSTREGIPYVNISIPGSGLGTVSQFDGHFKLDAGDRPAGMDSLVFSVVGYIKKGILIREEMDTIFVMLEPASFGLDAVLVSPKSPEEYIQMAVDKIPDNYIDKAFNGTLYQRSLIRLNGHFLESTEAIMKGYIMPVVDDKKDSTRIKMLAFKYFDEEEKALGSIVTKKRKKKPNKVAIEGLDSIMVNLGKDISEGFDIYTQVDSNFIKQLYHEGPQIEKTRFWFGKLLFRGKRQVLNIGFKGRLGGVAEQHGRVLLDYESLAIESFGIQIRTSSLKIKALLLLFGIRFHGADVVVRFNSIPTDKGWIPDLMSIDVFVDLEKIRIFSKNVPVMVEVNTYTRFLDVEVPGSDECRTGQLVKKHTALKKQFKSDPSDPLWEKYADQIKKN